MNAPINSAVIGLGVGRQHALTLATGPHSKLKWVYDFEPQRMREVLAETKQGEAAKGFEAILSDPATDLVSIATYDHLHANEVCAALNAGKHVFCEKPLCNSAEELALVRAAWARNPRGLRCNLVLRGAPLYQWLQKTVAAGELGEVYAFDGDYLYGRLPKITEGWRSKVDGYSVMRGGGVHMVDLMTFILGASPSHVTAIGNAIATRGTAFRYPDFVAATFEFRSGVIGRITANFGSVHRHQHVVRVFGTKATFIHDDQGARLYKQRDPGGPPQMLTFSPLPPSKGVLIPDFVESIIRDEDPSAAATREFDLIAACLASDQALAGQTRVPVGVP